MSQGKPDKINPELLLEVAASLPTSPRIFARLDQLIRNEDTALDYISSLVKMDPGLSAQILRVTNSAYYGASVKINEIGSAISRIGFNELRNILAMVVAQECFFQAVPSYGLTATEFSDRAIEVAVASETLAKRTGFDSNAPYIAGLLHQIGKLAINLYLERLDQVVDLSAIDPEKSILAVEMEVLGRSHYRVGADLLSHWQFEPEIWFPIKNQSSPEHAAAQIRPTALLTVAIYLADQLGGTDPDAPTPASLKKALAELGLDALDVVPLVDEVRFEINDRKNMLAMLL